MVPMICKYRVSGANLSYHWNPLLQSRSLWCASLAILSENITNFFLKSGLDSLIVGYVRAYESISLSIVQPKRNRQVWLVIFSNCLNTVACLSRLCLGTLVICLLPN